MKDAYSSKFKNPELKPRFAFPSVFGNQLIDSQYHFLKNFKCNYIGGLKVRSGVELVYKIKENVPNWVVNLMNNAFADIKD